MLRARSVLQRRGPSPAAPARQFAWLSYSGLLLIIFVLFDFVVWSLWGYGGDWSPLWVAGRLARSDPASVYDFELVTTLLVPLTGDYGIRPFVYPPSALILLTPLSFIPFWVSLACVSIAASLCLATVASRDETDRVLLLLSPPVVFTAIAGQPTLLVAALATWGMSRLERNQLQAGALLALGAMLKPTLLIMAPVGLIAARKWRALGSLAAIASAVAVASILLFGFAPWFAWIDALARFREVFEAFPALYRNAITPYGFVLRMGIEAPWITWAMLPVAVLATTAVFLRTGDWRARLAAMVAGSLLASPYAMNYELAAFAPVVLSVRRKRLADLALPIFWAAALFFNASLPAMLAVYAWAAARAFGYGLSSRDERTVEPRVYVRA